MTRDIQMCTNLRLCGVNNMEAKNFVIWMPFSRTGKTTQSASQVLCNPERGPLALPSKDWFFINFTFYASGDCRNAVVVFAQ